MNKIYKVVWSKVKHCYVVTSELAKRQTKGCGARSLRMATVSLGVAAALLYTGGALPLFSPSVAEAASYDAELKDDTTMRTFQATPKSFTIGESELPTGVTGISVYGNVALGMIPKIIASLPGDDGKTYGIRGIDWSQSTSLFSRASKSNPFGDTTAVTKRVNADRTQVITVSTTLGALMIEVGGANDVDGYTVTMESGQADEVVGGISYSGKVSNNTVNLNGGSVMSAYGGYTQGGAAETNHVVVDGGVAGFSSTGPVAGSYVYGGYSKNESGESKDVTGNTVTVEKGTVLATVYGGNTQAEGSGNQSGDATENIVTIKDGTLAGDMYGGYSSSLRSTSGKVEGNIINITGGVLDKVRNIQVNGISLQETAGVGRIYGGYTHGNDASGIAKDNVVTISGGTLRSDTEVTGGYSNANNAEHNIVKIESTYTGTAGNVIGGEAGGNGTAKKNEVTISGGTVRDSNDSGVHVFGGKASTGSAIENKVTINKNATVNSHVDGGYTTAGTAENNEVTIDGGNVNGVVNGGSISYEGDTTPGAVTGNTVTIKNGSKVGSQNASGIYGGYVAGGRSYGALTNAGDVTGNKVFIMGGEVYDVYGGLSELGTVTLGSKTLNSGDVTKNEVEISGGTVGGEVYGGWTNNGTAGGDTANDGNKVTIGSGTVKGIVYGGYTDSGDAKFNTVTISESGQVNNTVYGGCSENGGKTIGNTVTVGDSAKVTGGITAGFSPKSDAENNTVTVNNGTVSGYINGGVATGTAKENHIIINNGTVSYMQGGSGASATGNTIEVNNGTVSNTIRGGNSDAGTVSDNIVTINDGKVNGTIYGGSSNSGAVTNNKVTVTGGAINDVIWGGDSNGGDAKYNAVTISGDAKIVVEGIMGGRSWNSEATGNTVTISGGSFEPESQDPPFNTISITAGVSNANKLTAKDNVVNITGEVTGLDTAEISGYNYNVTTHSGNELHVGGTKTYDSNGTATVSSSAAWQGKSSDGTVNNKVKSVAQFESIVLHNVKWSTTLPVLEATKITNVGTLDITNMQFDQTPSNGESMALLKAGNDLGASGAGIGLAYKDGSTEKTATSAELATGVTFDSGALTDTAVNGVSVTGTQSKKVSLENSNYEIRYSFSSTISGITIATDTFTAGGTARAFGSGDNLTGATITNNLAFSDESKNSMQSGESMVILDATNAVAVEGATLPAFTSASYDVNFSDAIDGKVVTLSGTHTDTLALNSSKTQLTYTVGDMQVSGAKFDGNVTWDDSASYYTADTKYKFSGTTNVNATGLKVTGTTTNALKVGDAMTLLSAENMTASITNDQSADNKTASKITVNYNDDTTNGIALGAEATGKVAVATNAVNYEVTGVEIQSVDLAGWKGTAVDVQSETDDWTVKSGASITTGELANAGLDAMNPGDVKTILTADTTADFSVASITGNKAWQAGGTITDTDTSGVSVTGTTTGGGVKVDDTNKNVLLYQKDAKTITGITLGSVAFTKDGTVRSFDNSYNLTGADFTTTGFGISNAATATMNGGDTMVVVDATDAIKVAGEATRTLQDFTATNVGDAIAFTDQIDGKALTLGGTHQDTLEQNADKNQIIYKVGDKVVNKATFTGEVTWNDSEAYYTNDATKHKFDTATAVDVDATNLKVTGTTDKALKRYDVMTLLSAEGMTAGTVTPQSETNKTASKITVNYSDAASGIGFGATATGAVEATDNAVNYEVDTVTLNSVDLAGWNGTTSSVPGDWAIADGATIKTDGMAAPAVEPGSHVDILQNDTDNYFASATISGANTYQSTDFKDEMNGVTLEGKQDKGVILNSEKKHLIYAAGTKNTASVSFGVVEWQKDATLVDAVAGYDFTNVAEIGTDNFAVTYAKPEDVAVNDSMTLLKANETLTAIVNELKTSSSYNNYEIAPGVLMDGSITGTMSRSGNDVVFTATANQADKLTFTDVEWKDSGALLTRPSNITFAGADVDTSKINFRNIQELAANSRMTLVSDFGERVGTITGDTFTVGSGLQGEGAASLSGTDLVFTAKTGAESLTPTEATHETVMAMEAGTAVVAAGREYVDSAVEGLGLVSNMAPDGTSTFASMGGGVGRYKTGSHVDTHTWNAVVAVGSKRDHKKGNLEWGVFAEYGRGNYTLHDDNGGRGDGNTHYAGGGLLAKWTNKHDVYTEASFRMGRMSDSASNMLRDVLGNTYGYDVHANYFGGHVGLGKIYKVKGNKDLDVYGKFFYTRRNGVDFDAGGNHYSLDSVASKLLRIGARYGSNDRKWNWYGGLAYEYEFGGESKGSVDGLAIRSASIKGASVRGEIGVRLEATKTNPWKADISIYGYGGKHRGIGGNVSVAYMF